MPEANVSRSCSSGFIAEQAGADGITIHLREDRRHITDRDLMLISQTVQTRLNLEMAVTEEMIEIACQTQPDFCCLVPENARSDNRRWFRCCWQ